MSYRICSNSTQLHAEVAFLKEIPSTNGYPKKFIDKYFKVFK